METTLPTLPTPGGVSSYSQVVDSRWDSSASVFDNFPLRDPKSNRWRIPRCALCRELFINYWENIFPSTFTQCNHMRRKYFRLENKSWSREKTSHENMNKKFNAVEIGKNSHGVWFIAKRFRGAGCRDRQRLIFCYEELRDLCLFLIEFPNTWLDRWWILTLCNCLLNCDRWNTRKSICDLSTHLIELCSQIACTQVSITESYSLRVRMQCLHERRRSQDFPLTPNRRDNSTVSSRKWKNEKTIKIQP